MQSMENKKQLWEEYKLNDSLMGLVNSEEELATLTSDQHRISSILFPPALEQELFFLYNLLLLLKRRCSKW